MSGSARAGRRPEVLPEPIWETPVSAEGHCTGARQKAFFLFGPAAARFSFWRSKKRNGGRNGPAIIIAESPGRQVAAPTPLRRRAPGGSRFGGVPQSSHSPLCSSHHAGNAGSFGERVGFISLLITAVSFCLLLNGERRPRTLLPPKYSNS